MQGRGELLIFDSHTQTTEMMAIILQVPHDMESDGSVGRAEAVKIFSSGPKFKSGREGFSLKEKNNCLR